VTTTRTAVVTGSAAGIGRATCERLERDGYRVIDVDLHDASIIADLATPAGRAAMIDAVAAASGGTIDALAANAGVMGTPGLTVEVNYFGAVATCVGLRPLLAASTTARAVVTSSSSVLNGHDDAIVDACLAGDEAGAVAAAAGAGFLAYPSTKTAVARWVRQMAPTPEWAGAGIGLNAVAPGVVKTAMTAPLLADDTMRELVDTSVPMPFGGYCEPAHVAELIAFLAAPDTQRITGQIVFVDGGADAVLRGDDLW
jgi:NAD(P)-dependent dehydrogenase (short-subunit alcohol dehydrogenase family)